MKEELKNQIRITLSQRESIVFAYLFGSIITEFITPMSDIDIAVYLNTNVNISEERLGLIGDLMTTLKTDDIDLVILNSAPLTLRARIVLNKEMLIDKSPFLRHSFESLVMRQYYDFSIKENNVFERRYFFGRQESYPKKII